MSKNVVLLNFSGRKIGNCGKICDFVADFYNRTNVCLLSVNLESCGKCNYECLNPSTICPNLNEEYLQLMDRIMGADLIYYVIPNFCGYPCANYFAFNERSVGYFHMDRAKMGNFMNAAKRFIIVSNTEGFEKALSLQTKDEPIIQYMKSGKYKKRSTAGDIMDCQEAIDDLTAFLKQHG